VDIRIRNTQTMEDFKKALQFELKVWGGEPVPVHQTLTVAKNGGIVLGAFAKERNCRFKLPPSYFIEEGVFSPISGKPRKG
jgi:predicted GNAT superfamily acetyltransferase